MQDQKQMNIQTWGLLVLLAFIWGGSFLFGRIAVLEVPPLTTVMYRVGLAALTLWLIILMSKRKVKLTKWLIINCAIMGLLNNVLPFSFILYGQTELGAGLASVVNAMTPIWTLLIANWLTSDEKLTPSKLLGIIFGFLGVALLMGGDIWLGLAASALAQVSVLLATISYGFAGVFGKRFKDTDPIITATGQLTASSLIMIPIAFIFEAPTDQAWPSTNAVFSIIALAVICTAFAYILFFKILKSAGAVNVSLVTFLVPISAIIFGIIILNEQLEIYHLAGMLSIAAGLAIIDGRLQRKFKNLN